MNQFICAALLTLLTASCTSPLFESTLPTLVELNLEARQQIKTIKNRPGVATQVLKSIEVESSGVLRLKGITVTKVFKQKERTMLVATIIFETKTGAIQPSVIVRYQKGERIFKQLALKMISSHQGFKLTAMNLKL